MVYHGRGDTSSDERSLTIAVGNRRALRGSYYERPCVISPGRIDTASRVPTPEAFSIAACPGEPSATPQAWVVGNHQLLKGGTEGGGSQGRWKPSAQTSPKTQAPAGKPTLAAQVCRESDSGLVIHTGSLRTYGAARPPYRRVYFSSLGQSSNAPQVPHDPSQDVGLLLA